MVTGLAQNSTIEPISPELVLVDPTLRLSIPSPAPTTRVNALAPAPPTPVARIVAATPLPTPRPKRRALLVGTAAAFAVVGGLAILPRLHRSAERAPATATHLAPAHHRPASPRPRHAPLAPRMSRSVRWTPVPHASFYDLVLRRNGVRMLDVWPSRAHISVAALMKRARRRLPPGRYEWFVYPGFGNRRARPSGGTFYGKISARGVLSIHR